MAEEKKDKKETKEAPKSNKFVYTDDDQLIITKAKDSKEDAEKPKSDDKGTEKAARLLRALKKVASTNPEFAPVIRKLFEKLSQ